MDVVGSWERDDWLEVEDWLEVDREAAGQNRAPRRVGGAAVVCGELGLAFRQLVGASANEAANVEVEGEFGRHPELETTAEETTEIGVVLGVGAAVALGHLDARTRKSEAT